MPQPLLPKLTTCVAGCTLLPCRCVQQNASIISASWTSGVLDNPPLQEAGELWGRLSVGSLPCTGQSGLVNATAERNLCTITAPAVCDASCPNSTVSPGHHPSAPPPPVARTEEAGALMVVSAGNQGLNMKRAKLYPQASCSLLS